MVTPVEPDPICTCDLPRRRHRKSLHGRTDYVGALRSYLRHVPVAAHARTVERLYTVGRVEEAQTVQRLWEEERDG